MTEGLRKFREALIIGILIILGVFAAESIILIRKVVPLLTNSATTISKAGIVLETQSTNIGLTLTQVNANLASFKQSSDRFNKVLNQLNKNLVELQSLEANTDHNINKVALPELTNRTTKLLDNANLVMINLQTSQQKTNALLDLANHEAQDIAPKINLIAANSDQITKNTVGITQHLDSTTASVQNYVADLTKPKSWYKKVPLFAYKAAYLVVSVLY